MERINRIVIYLLFAFSLPGCKQYNLSLLEEDADLVLKDKIIFEEKFEEWGLFQRDGQEILFFKIKEQYLIQIIKEVKQKKW